MTRESREISVGVLTLFIFASFFALVSTGQDNSTKTDEEHYRVSAIFNRVDGLLPGDEVRMGGIRIGSVESQQLDNRHRAVLIFAIDKAVELPLDTSAAIHTSGLFGSKYVEIEAGGDFDYLTEGDEIMFTQDSLVISDLLELIIAEGESRQAN